MPTLARRFRSIAEARKAGVKSGTLRNGDTFGWEEDPTSGDFKSRQFKPDGKIRRIVIRSRVNGPDMLLFRSSHPDLASAMDEALAQAHKLGPTMSLIVKQATRALAYANNGQFDKAAAALRGEP